MNARWSNIVAILAGDYLLARASSLAASLGADVAALLAATIGELCRGQVLELQHLFDVRPHRGGVRVGDRGQDRRACSPRRVASAAWSAASTSPRSTRSRSFGHHLGMCFQVVDDVLDLTSTDEALGKHAGQDLIEGIYTLPVIYAVGDSAALRAMLGGPLDGDRLAEARVVIAANGSIDAALAVARDHATKANEALSGADGLDPTVTASLCRLVDTLVTRDR